MSILDRLADRIPPPPPNAAGGATAPAPAITSHAPSSTVHCRLLLVRGVCGSSTGFLWVATHNFPPQLFDVRDGHFKALFHLSPGHNNLQLDFTDAQTRRSARCYFSVTYTPLPQNPPLHLAIVLGSDSPLAYDDCPGCHEPPTLDTAVRRLRTAGYLWQAYTAAEMYRHGLGHRTFRLDEEWAPDTLSRQDSQPRMTAKVTVLRSKRSTAHIRDPCRAQQNKAGNSGESLYDIAMEAVNEHEGFRPGGWKGPVHVAVIFLDSKLTDGLVTGHAALGGGAGQTRLAIFGSHLMFSWPSCLENVSAAFNDARKVDTRFCVIDGEGDSYWMAANVGIGASLHEVGHLLGAPHQPSGIMLRDYPRLNRSFCTLEPHGPTHGKDECFWHRLDALRFVSHPLFALPTDPPLPPSPPSVSSVENGLAVTCPAGLVFVEYYVAGHSEFPKHHDELQEIVGGPDLSALSLKIFGMNNTETEIKDLPALLSPSATGTYRSQTFGIRESEKRHISLPPDLVRMVIHSGFALDGIEFFDSRGGNHLLGKRGGSPSALEIARGEKIVAVKVRHGQWMDAVEMVLSSGRSSGLCGNQTGGSVGEFTLPQGYRVCGIGGDVGGWVDRLWIEYCRE